MQGFYVLFSIALTHQRLCPLCQTVEHGIAYGRDVGDDAVACNAGVSCKVQNEEIKSGNRHGACHFADKVRESQLAAGAEMFPARSLPGEGNRIFLTTEVEQADSGAEHRGNTGCQGGTCHSHLEREHKDIIKDNVKQACGDGTDHGNGGVVVIPDKRACGVARHIEERKGKDTAEVGNPEILQCPICTEKSKEVSWK